MFSYDWFERSDDEIVEKWHYIRQQSNALESLLQDIPHKYHKKFLCYMRDFYWYWDTKEDLCSYIPVAMTLAQRLAKPPFFSCESLASEAITYFIDTPPPQLIERLFYAPDSSFANLEKICRSKNRTQLITNGMAVMLKAIPEFTIACFESYSKKLCTVAKLSGILRSPLRYSIIKQFSEHPLMKTPADSLPIHEYCDMVRTYCQDGVTSPIPKKLRAYVYEHYALSEQRILRYSQKLSRNLYATLLDLLERQIVYELQRHYPLAAKEGCNCEHTLQMMSLIDDNRRGFKRFLREYFSGNTKYLQTHHRTQAWRSAHSRIRFSAWTEGITLSHESKRHGPVRISVEHDPLEALKLGTYVGSCLGVGGSFTYSAAAVVLDDNKHVLYARNSHNNVIARQVVAISEEEQLVCFSVYPADADRELLTLFRNYDRCFADALGIEVYEYEDDQEYSIRHILSQDWWDDMPWDLSLPDSSESE